MRTKKIFIIIVAILLTSTLFLKAQDNKIKLENVVNEQFGTLLESLLVNGKIDEVNAKTYLKTVFGYDEGVSSYLETVNLSQQLNTPKQDNLSFDAYIASLNDNLIGLIPENYKKKILESPYYQGTLIGNELKTGRLSEQTVQLISDAFQNIRDEKRRSEAIREKFEKLTPKLSSLKNVDGTFTSTTKQNLKFNSFTSANWVQNTTIPEKQSSNAYNSLANKVNIIDDKLVLSNNIPKMSSHALFMFYTMRTFKNKGRFDFSKDFQLDVYFDIPDETRITGLGILIGKSFQLDILYKGGKNVSISTPSSYKITEQYGFLRSGDWPYNKIDKKVSKVSMTKEGHFKISIVKKGEVFSCLVDDEDIKVSNAVTYFPDKFFLGFKQAGSDSASITKIEIKHL